MGTEQLVSAKLLSIRNSSTIIVFEYILSTSFEYEFEYKFEYTKDQREVFGKRTITIFS